MSGAVFLAAAALFPPPPPSATVEVGNRFQHVAGLRLEESPTLGAAAAAFGDPSSCRRIRLEDGAVVRWNALGVRILLATLGAIPGGASPCAYDRMPIDNVRLTTRRWTTSLGLRVGDSAAKLRRLYPDATFHRRGRGEHSPWDSYWLVAMSSRCVFGDCSHRIRPVPRLVATIRDGRVAFFVVPVGAQGE
jgi:hypothetical protein